MGVDFGSLIIDLETLVSSSKEDFSNEFWSEYENYLKTYNRLLKDLQSLGFYRVMKPLEEVPFSEQSYESGYSKQEKAKLREINNAASNLLKKVKLLLSPPVKYTVNTKVRSNQLFVVVGNNDEMKTDVLQTLEKLELETIILDENSDIEQKLIDKVSNHTNVSFGLVLLSPENSVYSKQQSAEESKYQAPPNIIFDLGFLLGKLGKNNVAAVYWPKKDFEIPNRYDGIRWIEFKQDWYFKLINELKELNFDVDANKLSWI